ncbi:coenzyme F420-0:L-glutamate ligase [Micromonospora sp. HM5-17]|uniref:coenzyme F420-0:L-glutamate ligase n=1 Tax=Micromonospora sp. HM5-17 TaxID=2487710 RepID=UPI000F489E4C|nr:coenzyme F420-0:L-glutamate ligase [Micromonospora sp. HM5-17]ROT31546.1 coenzyme F420-0:L-glutamate ligase [Micromonospora sp. HM5-17]
MKLEVLPVLGIGDVTEGDDLAALIATAAPWLRDGDVLVVTSKIVSKAEGRLVDVPVDGPEREAARAEVLAAETARPVARRGSTRIVQTHHGFVMASAGVDASNVDRSRLVLLPKDPDASARALRAALRERHGADVAVIISDTMGRPWRNGLTDVALGVAGMPALRDHRGQVDPYGNRLAITQMAVVDELAGAGELVKGKCDQVPVAVIRGYLTAPDPSDGDGVVPTLVRDAAHDLFSLGTAEARAEGLRAAATLGESAPPPPWPVPGTLDRTPPGPTESGSTPATVDSTTLARAIDTVAGAVAPGTRFAPVTDERVRAELDTDLPAGAALLDCRPPDAEPEPAALIRFGADLHRLRAALAAEGLGSTVRPAPDGVVGAVLLVVAGEAATTSV